MYKRKEKEKKEKSFIPLYKGSKGFNGYIINKNYSYEGSKEEKNYLS